MEYDIALWTALTGLVLQAIALIPRDPGKRTREDEQALRAFSDAYHATQAYYSSRHGGATFCHRSNSHEHRYGVSQYT